MTAAQYHSQSLTMRNSLSLSLGLCLLIQGKLKANKEKNTYVTKNAVLLMSTCGISFFVYFNLGSHY